jgi:SAM-dependent methyltransferase
MLFFQVVLLAGYAYAHGVGRLLGGQAFLRIHGILALASLGVLAWGIARSGAPWLPPTDGDAGSLFPPLAILLTLGLHAGLPLVLLASTSPLVQATFARLRPEADPYRLYAVSNAGSLAGLLSYPVLLEPLVGLNLQAWIFSALFVFYLGILLKLLWTVPTEEHPEVPGMAEPDPAPARPWRDRAVWAGLAALGTVWLCAITNRISTDVASIPLLWIPPLALYLITFILVFETRWSFTGPAWRVGLGAAVLCVAVVAVGGPMLNSILAQYGPQALRGLGWAVKGLTWLHEHQALSLTLLVLGSAAGCLLLHGRLADLRPVPGRLTDFYLSISAGGAVGGMFVSLGGPLLFDQNHELGLATAATGLIVVISFSEARTWLKWPGLAIGALTAGMASYGVFLESINRTRYVGRDFFGTVGVSLPHPKILALSHGNTIHGIQFLQEPLRPASYYGNDSGIGIVLRTLNAERPSLRVGVVGLGVGNTAAFGRAGDHYDFFEISPRIIEIAGMQGSFFSVLKSSPAAIQVLQGDGRLMATREARVHGVYDVLLIDAFAGGHIPAHLLTVEALQGYRAALKPDGILVLHVSHDLPLDQQAGVNLREAGLTGLLVPHDAVLGRDRQGRHIPVESTSLYWVAAADPAKVFRTEFLHRSRRIVAPPGTPLPDPIARGMAERFRAETAHIQPWTDQRHSLASLLFNRSR